MGYSPAYLFVVVKLQSLAFCTHRQDYKPNTMPVFNTCTFLSLMVLMAMMSSWIAVIDARQFRFTSPSSGDISEAEVPDITADDEVVVDVVDHPSIGMLWQLDFDDDALAIVSYKYSSPAYSGDTLIVGGMQNRTIRLVGLLKKNNVQVIASKLYRRWESNGRLLDSFNFTVNVRERSRNAPNKSANIRSNLKQSETSHRADLPLAAMSGSYDPRSQPNFPPVRNQVFLCLKVCRELPVKTCFQDHWL